MRRDEDEQRWTAFCRTRNSHHGTYGVCPFSSQLVNRTRGKMYLRSRPETLLVMARGNPRSISSQSGPLWKDDLATCLRLNSRQSCRPNAPIIQRALPPDRSAPRGWKDCC